MTCLKSLIRLEMREEGVFKSSKCLISASQNQEDPEEDHPLECFAVVQRYV